MLETLLVIAGVVRGQAVLRYVAFAAVVPVIFKVYLYDTRSSRDSCASFRL